MRTRHMGQGAMSALPGAYTCSVMDQAVVPMLLGARGHAHTTRVLHREGVGCAHVVESLRRMREKKD
jgi:hypothetical protein